MTPAELLKYKNKLKLWRILHPDIPQKLTGYHCRKFCHCLCPTDYKLIENSQTGELIFHPREHSYPSSGFQLGCVEWIRRVQ